MFVKNRINAFGMKMLAWSGVPVALKDKATNSTVYIDFKAKVIEVEIPEDFSMPNP